MTYAVVTITVLTESGARYLLRQHKDRLYVSRLGGPAIGGGLVQNEVTTTPVRLIAEGSPMRIDFPGGRFIRTTPLVAVSYRVDRYLQAA